jgi:hypothetical protein
VLGEVRGLHVPMKPEELLGSLADPDSPGRSEAATCDGQTITGQTAPTGHGGPDPLPPGEGSGAATCHPRGRGGAGPATCLRLEALHGSPAHLPAFNAVAGPGAPKSKVWPATDTRGR